MDGKQFPGEPGCVSPRTHGKASATIYGQQSQRLGNDGVPSNSRSKRRVASSLRGPPNHSKSWPTWSSSYFHRLFYRCEVGQLDQTHPFSSGIREGDAPADWSSAFVGWRRVFEAHQSIHKVGQLGQVPIFIGLFTGVKLANFTNFTRSRHIFVRATFDHESLFCHFFCSLPDVQESSLFH